MWTLYLRFVGPVIHSWSQTHIYNLVGTVDINQGGREFCGDIWIKILMVYWTIVDMKGEKRHLQVKITSSPSYRLVGVLFIVPPEVRIRSQLRNDLSAEYHIVLPSLKSYPYCQVLSSDQKEVGSRLGLVGSINGVHENKERAV